MNMIELEINEIPVSVKPGTTILEAAKTVGVKIPKLCFHSDLEPWAACGICVVKVEGSPKMLRACATAVGPGMKVVTHDPEIAAQCPRQIHLRDGHATEITSHAEGN